MPEPLKNIYNSSFFEDISKAIRQALPGINPETIQRKALSDRWTDLELKQRMRKLAILLSEQLPDDFKEKISDLIKLCAYLKDNQNEFTWAYMFLPDIIVLHGIDDLKVSISAMEEITQFTTCEFAIRPFLLRYPDQIMSQMFKWSKHKEHTVRRFASEGCRPRLPWAVAIPALKKDPSPIIPILENLKDDDFEFVQRSVANNLNDISKDHPDLVLELSKKWQGNSKTTDWIIKHACRTLLKQGNPAVMKIFGYKASKSFKIESFEFESSKVKIGDYLNFHFQVLNESASASKIRLEYAMYFQLANGNLSRKVFKISERVYAKNSNTEIRKKHSFRFITTRKYYSGLHKLSIIINGVEMDQNEFYIKE